MLWQLRLPVRWRQFDQLLHMDRRQSANLELPYWQRCGSIRTISRRCLHPPSDDFECERKVHVCGKVRYWGSKLDRRIRARSQRDQQPCCPLAAHARQDRCVLLGEYHNARQGWTADQHRRMVWRVNIRSAIVLAGWISGPAQRQRLARELPRGVAPDRTMVSQRDGHVQRIDPRDGR